VREGGTAIAPARAALTGTHDDHVVSAVDQAAAGLDGDTGQYRPAEGLLAGFVARTDDGVVLVHVWESAEARSDWHNNPAHREAVRASGIATLVEERLVREYETRHVEFFR